MIIYSNLASGFLDDVPNISHILASRIRERIGEPTSDGELRSWEHSLNYMADIIRHPSIPKDAGVALEYSIPVTNNRIDFIISGLDVADKKQAVLIELKQWSKIDFTPFNNIVSVNYADGPQLVAHPSYQVASYASLLYDYNEVIQSRKIWLHPCAYLHNFVNDRTIKDARFSNIINRAPVFLKDDSEKLVRFINQYVVKGDRDKAIYEIENSRIYPSKSLVDCVTKMAQGIPEFKLIDSQKVVYEQIIGAYSDWVNNKKKTVIVIKGGPGTGKSVIAVKSLIEMTSRHLLAHYVSKNAAPRNVFYKKFMDDGSANASIKNLFKSSGVYYQSHDNEFAMLLVDEAHRLQLHSGAFGNLGDNQIKEIMRAAIVSVFFIDERQRVSFSDIGTCESIVEAFKEVSKEQKDSQGIPFIWNWKTLELKSQFRCSGSDIYLNWLDHILQYGNLSPISLPKNAYNIRLYDNPKEMMSQLRNLNKSRNKCRVVAGYCWPWNSKTSPSTPDIEFKEVKFSHRWNLNSDKTWAISPNSFDQIGCIHTCQGLEFDYVGVIIGKDLICRNGKILVDPSKRASDDFSIRGWKKQMQQNPEDTKNLLREIIKNTYRTLMTRGMKGCFLYVMDEELRDYINRYIQI